MRRVVGVLGVLGAAVAIALPAAALAGGHRAAASATRQVVIKNYAFNPGRLTINRGDSVTWRFEDGSTQHNVTATGFRSSPTKSSGTYTVRFTRAGSYSYTCTLHPWMAGTIVVRK